jgi:ferredoxin-NADP reductase/DMSO/TMAO reductase YedYZ heme-binding membrane subunit
MKEIKFAKLLVLLNGAIPVALLGIDALRNHLGANPVNFAIRTTGFLALIFLLLSLTTTPLGRLTGWHWLTHFRRTLGLYAFFHTLVHFILFFVLDRALSVTSTVSEMFVRPYLTVGAAGLLMMVPLAVTSTNGMIKRLGSTQWKRLHRLAYLAAIAGVVHYYLLVKADVRQPIAFAIVLTALLGYRLAAHYLKLRAAVHGAERLPATAATTMSRPKFWSGRLKVARIFVESPDVRTFRLAPTDSARLPFDYLPGQYLNLSLTIDGRKVNRSYTIASSPTRNGSCEISVKREASGTASRFLHDCVRAGDILDVSAPAGRFTFTGAEADSVVLIAGGVGITPLMSKIRYLTDRAWPGEIYLVYCVRTEADIIFREELEYLQKRHPNLHVTITLSRAENATWRRERGRITPALMMRIIPNLQALPIHFCGPEEMNQSIRQMLQNLGVPANQIKSESFTAPHRKQAPPPPVAAETNGHAVADGGPDRRNGSGVERTATLRFARSDKSAIVPETKTVLDAAEDLGVNIDYDCRAGICGTCRIKLLSGQVRMDSEAALNSADRADGMILACQAHCLEEVTVEL